MGQYIDGCWRLGIVGGTVRSIFDHEHTMQVVKEGLATLVYRRSAAKVLESLSLNTRLPAGLDVASSYSTV